MDSLKRNIAYFVVDQDVRFVVDQDIKTDRTDDFLKEELRGFNRAETSSFKTAFKFVSEFREEIFLLVICTLRDSVELEELLSNIHGIPYTIIVKPKKTKHQIERILEGKRIQEPFDSVLENWLQENFTENDSSSGRL